MSINILIVNTSDLDGGAARAAYRLHQALIAQGINSQMLVQNKMSNDHTVLGPESTFEKLKNRLRPLLDSLPSLFRRSKATTFFSFAWLPSNKLVKKINSINPDIVHLHWINKGMLRLEDIAKIQAPIVWSLHDMWPFSGGWHYDEIQGSQWEEKQSLKIFKRKEKLYTQVKNLTFLGVSHWLKQCAINSHVSSGNQILSLPNPIDSNIFKASDKCYSRTIWNLPQEKKLILFGALHATCDPRKGYSKLKQAISLLDNNNIEFVIFGSSSPENPPDLGCKVHYLGSLYDDVSLVTLYSAVDVMVVPSLQEAFGQTASESMACGTPVVAFAYSGLLDIIEHKKNGYLAKPYDSHDLAKGITWVLKNNESNELGFNARQKVLREFASNVVSKKYIRLYQEILNE